LPTDNIWVPLLSLTLMLMTGDAELLGQRRGHLFDDLLGDSADHRRRGLAGKDQRRIVELEVRGRRRVLLGADVKGLHPSMLHVEPAAADEVDDLFEGHRV
jgi:hypothetical protein